MINREVCQKPKQDSKQDWSHHRRRLDSLTRRGLEKWSGDVMPSHNAGSEGRRALNPCSTREFCCMPWPCRKMHERRAGFPSFGLWRYFRRIGGNARNSSLSWSFRKLDEMRWECLWLVHNYVRWLRLCSLRTKWPPDLWFLTTLQSLLLYSPRVPRRRCLPGKSTSGWTTRRCLVRASFRENSFSSVQSAHLSLSFLLLWIVSSCLVKS